MGTNLYSLSDGIANEMSILNYEKEDVLQQIIADNPKLILRSSDPDNARLYLISREMKSFNPDYDSDPFSLDHLFVNQEGMPVLVEVKRSSDTRIRREVTAQLLDYAARASSWDVTELKNLFMESNKDLDPEELEHFSDDFWNTVANNLRAERMKLVFAADEIPDTLKILIEFLDRAMPNIEVYGVEIHQFKSEDSTLLTTECIENALTTEVKTSREKGDWDYKRCINYIKEHDREDFLPVWDALLNKSSDLGIQHEYGTGRFFPSVLLKCYNLTVMALGVDSKKTYVEITSRILAQHLGCKNEDIIALTEGVSGRDITKDRIEFYNTTEKQIVGLEMILQKLVTFILDHKKD